MMEFLSILTNVNNVLIHEQIFDEINNSAMYRSVYLGRFLARL